MTPEGLVKKDIFNYLNGQDNLDAFNISSQGVYDPARGIFRNQRGQNRQKGMADILILLEHRDLCIPIFVEVKSAKGRLSPDQKEFGVKVSKRNAFYGVARSCDEVKKLIAQAMENIDALISFDNMV